MDALFERARIFPMAGHHAPDLGQHAPGLAHKRAPPGTLAFPNLDMSCVASGEVSVAQRRVLGYDELGNSCVISHV